MSKPKMQGQSSEMCPAWLTGWVRGPVSLVNLCSWNNHGYVNLSLECILPRWHPVSIQPWAFHCPGWYFSRCPWYSSCLLLAQSIQSSSLSLQTIQICMKNPIKEAMKKRHVIFSVFECSLILIQAAAQFLLGTYINTYLHGWSSLVLIPTL